MGDAAPGQIAMLFAWREALLNRHAALVTEFCTAAMWTISSVSYWLTMPHLPSETCPDIEPAVAHLILGSEPKLSPGSMALCSSALSVANELAVTAA